MVSVVIIDDEALVRIGLKSMVNWPEYGFEIIGEASNGQAGFDMILNLKPDIVITDIKMPVMDGMQMIEQVVKSGINTRFILLTGYNEFELARQAMKLGVSEYIIKLELEPEKLIDALSKLKERISIDLVKKDKDIKFQRLIRANSYAVREEFFKKVIGKVITDCSEIKDELEYLDIKLDENNLICAVIKIIDTGKMKGYEQEEINLLEFSILNIVDEIVNDKLRGYTFKWNQNEYVIMFSDDGEPSREASRVKVEALAQRIILMLKQYFNVDISVGVSNIHKGFSSMGQAYSECSQVLKQGFYMGTGKVAFFSDLHKTDSLDKNELIHGVTNDILKYIEQNDIESIQITFENMIEIFAAGKLSKALAYDVCAKIAYLIGSAFEKDPVALQLILGDEGPIFELILKLTSLQDMIVWLKKVDKDLCSYLGRQDQDQNNRIVAMAKKYVDENLQKTINLPEVAEKLNMSTGYFSTVFKKLTGLNFTEYVTEAKINHAKRLLKESNCKIYEIAQLTGYENAYYFSKVFKKVTGMTPSEFV